MTSSESAVSKSRRRKSLLSTVQAAGGDSAESLPWETPVPPPTVVQTVVPTPPVVHKIVLEDEPVPEAPRKGAKERPKKVATMTLDDLYAVVDEKQKATPSVFARIAAMEDFSAPAHRWCSKVCRAPCSKEAPNLMRGQKDVVILNFVRSMDGKFRTGKDEDAKLREIWTHMVKEAMPDLSVGLANVLKCQPKFPSTVPMNRRKVTAAQAKACAEYLHAHLAAYPPKVIVVTDTKDLAILGIKQASVGRNLSQFRFYERGGLKIPVVITLNVNKTVMIRQTHSGGMWGPDMYFLIAKDLQKAGKIARGEFVVRNSPEEVLREMVRTGQIRILKTLTEVQEACLHLASLGEKKVISWDIESTGLDPWAPDARILMMQFGVTDNGVERGIVIPLWHRGNHFYNPDHAWPMVATVLLSDTVKVGHHGQFDLKYTAVTTGVRVKNYRLDTLLMLHSRCSGLQKAYGLKKAVWDEIPESGLGGYDDVLEHLAHVPDVDGPLEEDGEVGDDTVEKSSSE